MISRDRTVAVMWPTPSEDMLSPFGPDPDRMLDSIRRLVDDSMLEEIAQLDCGDHNAGPQLAALTALRNSGRPPAPMGWEPMEALELARWATPETESAGSTAELEREHRMRAFATAALLRAAAEPANQDGRFVSSNDTLAALLSSARSLGDESAADVASFVAWQVSRLGADQERPFFAYALLVLAVLGSTWTITDPWLSQLCTWVVDEEDAERKFQMETTLPSFQSKGPGEWLLSLTCFNQHHGIWRALNASADQAAAALPAGSGRDQLRVITGMIAPPS